ncbi:hypothetical protein HDU98_008152 [Podochytrium sp. JEL0797]|nr:hypothetical protein HDU98_008152 [Podochytrium sp. JEL0797]
MLTSSKNSTNSNMRRIMIEFKELEASPLVGIHVTPNPANATELCARITPQEGIYEGIPLHLGLSLKCFPASSPVVTMDTLIDHPNVFSREWICCDLLKGHLFTDSRGRISGYSPAYSLGAVLLQLMSFFSATRIEQDHEEVYTNTAGSSSRLQAIANVRRFCCKKCGYNGTKMGNSATRFSNATKGGEEVEVVQRVMGLQGGLAAAMPLDLMPNELLLDLSEHMSVEDLIKFGHAVPRFAGLVQTHNLTIRRDQRCFYYKTGIKDDTLGVGIWLASSGRNRDMKPVDFDIFSHKAFQEANLRQTIWGHGFTHFLPLALTPQHFSKSVPLIEKTLCDLDCGKSSHIPAVAIRILSRLMNLMVVDLMKTMDDKTGGNSNTGGPRKSKLIASEMALIGYSQLLHLLLAFTNKYPEISTTAEYKLAKFMNDKESRGKGQVANIGEFLVLLFCQSKYTWSALALPVFREVSARNVVWMLDPKHGNKPFLAFIEPDATSDFRLSQTFSAQQTSLRLLMFQVLFMRRIGLGNQPPAELLAQMNRRFGYPAPGLAETLVEDIKGIYAVKSFNAFLPLVGIPLPTKEYFSQFLKDSIAVSERRRYHKTRYTLKQLYTLRVRAEPGFDQERTLGFVESNGPMHVESFFPDPKY